MNVMKIYKYRRYRIDLKMSEVLKVWRCFQDDESEEFDRRVLIKIINKNLIIK